VKPPARASESCPHFLFSARQAPLLIFPAARRTERGAGLDQVFPWSRASIQEHRVHRQLALILRLDFLRKQGSVLPVTSLISPTHSALCLPPPLHFLSECLLRGLTCCWCSCFSSLRIPLWSSRRAPAQFDLKSVVLWLGAPGF
jgi:hypothetical protein